MTELWPNGETASKNFHDFLTVVTVGVFGYLTHPAVGLALVLLVTSFWNWDLYIRPTFWPETELTVEERAEREWLERFNGRSDDSAVTAMREEMRELRAELRAMKEGRR